MRRLLSTFILLGLLLATAAAFAITEHLKLIKSPIYATDVTKVFSPICHCATDKAKIGFKLRSADSLTVTIVDSSGHTVATLATKVPEQTGAVTFEWDGRTDAGEVAPESSSYQPEIELASARRTILMPNRIAVDRTAPTVVSASAGDGLLISGAHHTIALDYVLGGRARAAVYVRGRRVILGRSKQPRGQVNWNGKRHGRSLPAGRYVLEVGAVDIAGNEASPADRKQVVVRITPIALGEGTIRVAPGARFTVDVRTAAARYAWRLAGKRGTETKKRLRLRAPSKPGRHRLVVSEHHHSASALVIVRRR